MATERRTEVRAKYCCTCGFATNSQRSFAGHISKAKRAGETTGHTRIKDESPYRPEVSIDVTPPGRPRVDAQGAEAASGATPTYLRVNVTVPALLYIYYDAFRRYFKVIPSFSEWITDCVLTLIEYSEYELMLVRKGEVDIDDEQQDEQPHSIDDLLRTYALIVRDGDTFEEDGANDDQGDAKDTWPKAD